jgi:hypothetical protein
VPALGASTTLDGIVAGKHGSCPEVSFSIGAWTVTTDKHTAFRRGACPSVKDGKAVTAVGTITGDNRLNADTITKDDD